MSARPLVLTVQIEDREIPSHFGGSVGQQVAVLYLNGIEIAHDEEWCDDLDDAEVRIAERLRALFVDRKP